MKIPKLLSRLKRSEARIKIERTHYGIKLILPEELDEEDLLKLMAVIPAGAYKLPDNEGIALDFQARRCSGKFILKLIAGLIWPRELKIIAWLSADQDNLKLFQTAGLNTNEPVQGINIQVQPQKENLNNDDEYNNENNNNNNYPGWKIIYNSMRSGQRIDTDGDILLWGHLNAGAEICAGGSIIVAGKMHGVVHAGAYGREDVFIWSGVFETPQVRIANKLCYAGNKSVPGWQKSVLITLENGTPMIREDKFIKLQTEVN